MKNGENHHHSHVPDEFHKIRMLFPQAHLPTIRMFYAPLLSGFGIRKNVRRQVVLVVSFVAPIEGSDGFKMAKNIGIETAVERERPTVNDRMRLVQHHVTGFHRDVMCLAVMAVNLQWPKREMKKEE